MRRGWWWITVTLILGLAPGCAFVGRVGQAPQAATEQARGLAPPAGRALVYVVRPSGEVATIRMPVTCDDTELGSTTGKRFVYALLDPGVRLFATGAKGVGTSELPIVLEAGRTYYFEQELIASLVGVRCRLVRLDDVRGRARLLKCSLSAELVPAPATTDHR
jgi:hypothetical protein